MYSIVQICFPLEAPATFLGFPDHVSRGFFIFDISAFFSKKFPLSCSQSNKNSEYHYNMAFQFQKLSVLIVEDTLPMQKLVGSVLDTLGVGKVYKSSDGNEGYERFKEENPDIVIADWHMVPTSGIELVSRIRKDVESPNKMVPIIMMTGYSAMPRVAEARDTGATEFLVKPFSANDLARRIAYVINKPRDFIETADYFGPDRRRRVLENYKGPFRRAEDNPITPI